MTTFMVPTSEVFAKTLQDVLEERIEKCCEKARVDAINQIQAEINKIVSATALQIFELCEFDRDGKHLRITVDTTKLFKPSETTK